MKSNISDMMEHLECIPIELGVAEGVSAEHIREKTMQKVHTASARRHGGRRLSRLVILAAALVLMLSVTAGAALNWNGFSFTGGMSRSAKRALLDEVQSLTAGAEIDQDGTVHYYDKDGDEVLTLSSWEAAQYERERIAAAEQKVKDSTSLVDLSTMPLMSASATEIAVGKNGTVEDFALGSGSLLLFHPEGQDGYELKAGDTVTITADADRDCHVEFGCFRDGTYVTGESVQAQEQKWTYTVQEDGMYCFYMEYYSSDAGLFTGCTVTVE